MKKKLVFLKSNNYHGILKKNKNTKITKKNNNKKIKTKITQSKKILLSQTSNIVKIKLTKLINFSVNKKLNQLNKIKIILMIYQKF